MNIWHTGRWSVATQFQSPNFGTRPENTAISLIVLHNISLPPFEYGSDAISQLFTNTINGAADDFFAQLVHFRVSSHFVVRRCGEICQFVSCDDMAYHAGVSQFMGRERCNDYSIGIELEGCDFEPFTPEQYQALAQLLSALHEQYPITAVTGHQDIAPNRKTDPGHFFDWDWVTAQGFAVNRNV